MINLNLGITFEIKHFLHLITLLCHIHFTTIFITMVLSPPYKFEPVTSLALKLNYYK